MVPVQKYLAFTRCTNSFVKVMASNKRKKFERIKQYWVGGHLFYCSVHEYMDKYSDLRKNTCLHGYWLERKEAKEAFNVARESQSNPQV